MANRHTREILIIEPAIAGRNYKPNPTKGEAMANGNGNTPSKAALESKIERYEKAKERDKQQADMLMSKGITTVTASFTALAAGAFYQAVPRAKTWRKDGTVTTRPFLALIGLAGAVFLEDEAADAFEGVMYGAGVPVIDGFGANIVDAFKG